MDASRRNKVARQPCRTHVNDALFPLQLLHDHFHDERPTRIVKTSRWMYGREKRVRAKPGGIRFLGTAVSPVGPTRAGAFYVPKRLYFAFARLAAVQRHRRHRLHLPLLHLLSQEQRRDEGIDTGVTVRADIDSDSDAS